jgi:hypothetical protein
MRYEKITASVCCECVVTSVEAQASPNWGSVLFCRTNRTGSAKIYVTPELFGLLATDLRPYKKRNREGFDTEDGARVRRFLMRKRVKIRWQRVESKGTYRFQGTVKEVLD